MLVYCFNSDISVAPFSCLCNSKNAACHSLKSANASKSVKSEKGERDSTPVSVCVGAALQ